jgi:hypothetical protein
MLSKGLRVKPGRQETWSVAPAPCGPGCILVAEHTRERAAWVIAPPTVRLRPGEAQKVSDQWRVARYEAVDLEELLIAIGSHVPGAEWDVTAQALQAVLPADLQTWVSRVCDRQLALADGFGRQDPRLPPIEAQVRAAATLYAQLAGPAESSRRAKAEFEHAPGDLPDTVDELLGRATGQTQPHSVTWLGEKRHLDTAPIRCVELLPIAIRRVLGAALNLHQQASAAVRRMLRADDLSLLASIKGGPPSTAHFVVNVEARTARSITWIGPSDESTRDNSDRQPPLGPVPPGRLPSRYP